MSYGLISIFQDTCDVLYIAGDNNDLEGGVHNSRKRETTKDIGVFYLCYIIIST